MAHKIKKANIDKAYYDVPKTNNDDKTAVLKFSMCDDKYPLHDLSKDDLKEFISFAKLFEKLQWRVIKTHGGLKYEQISELRKPDAIEKDITLSSMRVSQKFRIIGYRQEEFFYIVWFDKNHEAYDG